MPATPARRLGPALLAAAVGAAVAAIVATPALRARTRQAPPIPTSSTATDAGFDPARLAQLDVAMADAIAAHQLPGAVILIGRDDAVVWRKAYGQRVVSPTPKPMTPDTIFDMASLTKVIATAPAVMQLVEEGRIRLVDPVAAYIPGFGVHGKDHITIRDLLTHMSGLRPDLDRATNWAGRDAAMALAIDEVPQSPPGQRFVYSDINFILLADIVSRVRHAPFETVVHDRILAPLGMAATMFRPPVTLMPRIAPNDGTAPRGVVHDPTARRMGGVAGHAGLFSTADDLARFCRMMLHGGALGSARVLAPLTVARMTAPATPTGEPNVRGLGWDLDSVYSGNRGDLLPLGSYGHTGFTGTSIWIDPATRVFVVFLSNRLHPDGTGNVTPLRSKVASIVAAALTKLPPAPVASMTWPRPPAVSPSTAASASASASAPTAPVSPGIDVLRAEGFSPLRGLRVGLLTNHTGVAADGTATIDLLASAADVHLVALFSPEHGIRGLLDAAVPSSRDEKTGLPIHSLYGATARPTAAMLTGLDAVVIDLQDIGTRFYTYMTTMAYMMEEAAAHHVKVIVLDRPNPIGGMQVEGPPLDPGAIAFTGYFAPMPIRHGLTIGELARLFNGERHLGTDLTVVPMTGWRRGEWFDETGLPWVNPSPNMRSLAAATLYPGIGAFERTNISVGRGTDAPFEHIGAPWIDGSALAAALNARRIPGLRVYPVSFIPTTSTYAGQLCHGVALVITDRDALRPVRAGVELAAALWHLFPARFRVDDAGVLFGSADGVARIKAGDDPAAIAATWTAADTRWEAMSRPYRLY
jgi:uncharacterized protein YbbC (DUF1343 family)/CubicO group peptidase (beta-lactamase class C family)